MNSWVDLLWLFCCCRLFVFQCFKPLMYSVSVLITYCSVLEVLLMTITACSLQIGSDGKQQLWLAERFLLYDSLADQAVWCGLIHLHNPLHVSVMKRMLGFGGFLGCVSCRFLVGCSLWISAWMTLLVQFVCLGVNTGISMALGTNQVHYVSWSGVHGGNWSRQMKAEAWSRASCISCHSFDRSFVFLCFVFCFASDWITSLYLCLDHY